MDAIDAEELFPTHGPLDEDRQIGRTATIVALTERMRERGDALLLENRRVGKTSVVRAALTRARLQLDGITGEVDLTAANVRDGPALARALMRALHGANGTLSLGLQTRAVISDGLGRFGRFRGRAERLVHHLGVDELDPLVDLTELVHVGAPRLDAVLEQLARVGHHRPVVIFLDEIQELARWKDAISVQQSLAAFLRMDGRRAALVAAGSDRSATEAIFAKGSPLHWNFDAFPLPPIDDVEWHEGLADRFASAGFSIEGARIWQILKATDGHPLRTMTVAKEALREARAAGETEVSWGAVDAALQTASVHPSWST